MRHCYFNLHSQRISTENTPSTSVCSLSKSMNNMTSLRVLVNKLLFGVTWAFNLQTSLLLKSLVDIRHR